MENWKEYWVTKELKEHYRIKVSDKHVIITFPDGDIYAKFDIKKDVEGEYYVYDQAGDLLNGEFDYSSTFNEVVCSCLYYFYSRY